MNHTQETPCGMFIAHEGKLVVQNEHVILFIENYIWGANSGNAHIDVFMAPLRTIWRKRNHVTLMWTRRLSAIVLLDAKEAMRYERHASLNSFQIIFLPSSVQYFGKMWPQQFYLVMQKLEKPQNYFLPFKYTTIFQKNKHNRKIRFLP